MYTQHNEHTETNNHIPMMGDDLAELHTMTHKGKVGHRIGKEQREASKMLRSQRQKRHSY